MLEADQNGGLPKHREDAQYPQKVYMRRRQAMITHLIFFFFYKEWTFLMFYIIVF